MAQNPLRSKVIRLAHAKPELRAHLLPLLKTSRSNERALQELEQLQEQLVKVTAKNEAAQKKIEHLRPPRSKVEEKGGKRWIRVGDAVAQSKVVPAPVPKPGQSRSSYKLQYAAAVRAQRWADEAAEHEAAKVWLRKRSVEFGYNPFVETQLKNEVAQLTKTLGV